MNMKNRFHWSDRQVENLSISSKEDASTKTLESVRELIDIVSSAQVKE